jgi:hypothetical protein
MDGRGVMRFLLLVATVAVSCTVCAAQLRRNYYAGVCPEAETVVRGAVAKKFQQTFITVGALVHLYFHDCFVQVTSMPMRACASMSRPARRRATACMDSPVDTYVYCTTVYAGLRRVGADRVDGEQHGGEGQHR